MDPQVIREAEHRIEREYLEMPGLMLTATQTRKLFGLPQDVCDAALGALVQHDFLVRTARGAFLRRSSR
jgi:hypothetical protein